MTALDHYAKLEAIGRYHDGDMTAPREVVVSFGQRSLIIMSLDDKPIAHWPLASLRATGAPAQLPVEIAPDPVSEERLVLDDAEMSAAIAQVCPDLHRAPPTAARRPPWRAIAAVGALAALVTGAVALWPMLPENRADLIPPAREAALGQALAARAPVLVRSARPPAFCTGEEGLAALRKIADRLSPFGSGRRLNITVLDDPGQDALALPGGHLVLLRGLLEAARTPEEVAAVIAHAIGHMEGRHSLGVLLDQVGLATLARMALGDVTGDEVMREAVAAASRVAYSAAVESQADAAAFLLLEQAGLPTLPHAALAIRLAASETRAGYLDRHPWTRARTNVAAEADRIGEAPFDPALRDRDWIALGTICDRTRTTAPARY